MGERVNNERSLRRLGREVAQELDTAPVDPAIERARARLFDGEGARAPSPSVATRWKGFAGLAIAGLAALGAVALRPRSMGFEVGDPPVSGSVGAWVAAPSASPITVRFEEGSRFELGLSARARVVSARAGGATLELASGDLFGDVSTARDDVTFRITAGPFEVLARQARLRVRWDAERERLEIEGLSGTVVVKGPGAPAGVAVPAGRSLSASVKEGRIDLDAGPTPR